MAPPSGFVEGSGAMRVDVLDDLLGAGAVACDNIFGVTASDASDERERGHIVECEELLFYGAIIKAGKEGIYT